MCGRPTGCVTARLPRPPNAIGRLVARHPLSTAGHPPHTPKPTLQKGWAPWKTPFPGGPAAIPSCSGAARAAAACTKRERTEEDRAHREEAGPVQPAAARGGGEGTGPERRAAAARGVRVASLGLQARTPSRGPRAAPRPRPPELWMCRIPGRADPERITYPSPQRGTGPGGGARRVPSVSATLSSPPTPLAVVVVAAAVELGGLSVPLGNNVIPHTPHT